MYNLNQIYKELLQVIKKESPFTPDLAIILGSGLGNFADSLEIILSIDTSTLKDYPLSTVEGHRGKIIFAKYENKNLILFQGRIHFYEGYKIYQTVLPAHISYYLGIKKILLTNAAGGINSNFKPADLMLANSFNGLFLKKELTELMGLSSIENKNNFLNLPSKEFNEIIINSSLEEKIYLKEGIYFYSKGPSYETPAEIRMFKNFGGDAAGMSTINEAYYAAFLGMNVACISCITNYAAGVSTNKLSHNEVIETANLVKNKFEKLIKRIIKNI